MSLRTKDEEHLPPGPTKHENVLFIATIQVTSETGTIHSSRLQVCLVRILLRHVNIVKQDRLGGEIGKQMRAPGVSQMSHSSQYFVMIFNFFKPVSRVQNSNISC